ncbi:hypothetical protein CK203_026506 [Vitis vinifera]|uniref:Uncharacterized protein n=1 Tax=Vitis vinifera TaxID=29760 RepID=A0A438IVW0_VITVI|nr:hypothetical protein CK203_026506 [Vitis vinifera]
MLAVRIPESLHLGLHVIDSIMRPLRIYCDNSVAMRFSKNNKTTGGSKHIDIKYLVVQNAPYGEHVPLSEIPRRGFVLQPLLLALDSTFVKVMEPALEWLFKLYSLGLISGMIDGKEMIEEYGNHNQWRGRGRPRRA